jgi:hypothetical protein
MRRACEFHPQRTLDRPLPSDRARRAFPQSCLVPDSALKVTAQCGMIALELLETIYGAKFELLGIKAAMLELRRTL